MFYKITELSGGQQDIVRFNNKDDALKVRGDLLLSEEELNEDERKVIADLDATNWWQNDNVMIDTADEGDLVHFAKLLGVKGTHGWEDVLASYKGRGGEDMGWYELAQELQEEDEGYEAMLAINNELKQRTRFVALATQSEK